MPGCRVSQKEAVESFHLQAVRFTWAFIELQRAGNDWYVVTGTHVAQE